MGNIRRVCAGCGMPFNSRCGCANFWACPIWPKGEPHPPPSHALGAREPGLSEAGRHAGVLKRASAGVLLEKCDDYVGYAPHLRDQVERRLLKSETIPQEEKIFSVFETPTRWISKCKAGTPVARGVPVCVMEDQHPFILGHQILWEGGDRDGIVSCRRDVQEPSTT